MPTSKLQMAVIEEIPVVLAQMKYEDPLEDPACISSAMTPDEMSDRIRPKLSLVLNETTIHGLYLDTMADVSTITKKVVMEVLQKDFKNKLDSKNLPQLMNASNQKIDLIGAVSLVVKTKNLSFEQRFLVVEELPGNIQGLLGLDIHGKLGI